jgi:hypothetical protein
MQINKIRLRCSERLYHALKELVSCLERAERSRITGHYPEAPHDGAAELVS